MGGKRNARRSDGGALTLRALEWRRLAPALLKVSFPLVSDSVFYLLKKNHADCVSIAFSDAYTVGTFWKELDLRFPRVQKLSKSLQGARRTSTKREAYKEILVRNI